MSSKIDSKKLPALGGEDVVAEMQWVADKVLNEPKIPTLDKKIIVEASTTGHYPGLLWERFGIKHMPPWSVDEQVSTIIECVKAGAAGIHCHPRDPSAQYNFDVDEPKAMSPELIAEIFDKVYQIVDFVPLGHAWHPKNWGDLGETDFITPTKKLLDIGKGNKYIQGNAMIAAPGAPVRRGIASAFITANSLREGIYYLEENNVKPLIAVHVDYLVWFKSNVLDTGVMRTRPHLNIQDGKHFVNRIFADPMSYLNLISSIELVKELIPDCTMGVHAGSRNWLPITTMGILLGVDLVRVGIENQFWAYPHKNECIKKPAESVERVVQIARALGRDIATPDEARKILGIKVTSPI